MRGYKIDFLNNTITMNYKFAAAASQYNSSEYKLLCKIKKDFPELREQIKSGRVAKSPRPNKRLTYENMKAHIRAYENAQELLDVFETVKALSKPLASPYKYVSDWFLAQFPNYKEIPVFKDNISTVTPIPAPEVKDYATKLIV